MSAADLAPTPFGDPAPEVPLSDPPLIVALAQVRFPTVASIAREDFIGPFQESIREDYPYLVHELETVSIQLSEGGVQAQTSSSPVWRFLDNPEKPVWKVSLATSFVALDTVDYPSHAEFLERLRAVLAALSQTVKPVGCTRLGLRYVDRIEAGPDLASLIRPEMLGVTCIEPGDGAELAHILSDAQFNRRGAMLHGRWGLLPPNAVLDALYGSSLEVPSWILDLDMYADNIDGDFDVDRLVHVAEGFANDIYRFFLWAVEPELLRRCGGNV